MVLPQVLPPLSINGWMLPVEARVLTNPPCGFCRQEGHERLECPSRLRLICNSCRVPGHLARDCARFGDRDQQIAAQRGLGYQLPPRPTNSREVPRPQEQRPQQQQLQHRPQQQQQQQQIPTQEAEGFLTAELEGIPPVDESQGTEGTPQSPSESREQSPEFDIDLPESREQSPAGDLDSVFITQVPGADLNSNNNNNNSHIFVRDSMEGVETRDNTSPSGSTEGSLRSTSSKRRWGIVKAARKTMAYLTGSQTQPLTQLGSQGGQMKTRAASIRSARTTQSSQSTRTTRSTATGRIEKGKGRALH
jgi:hypothetical protein